MSDSAVFAQRILAGQVRAAARVISMLENGDPTADEVAARLFPHTGRAEVVGITGPPGAGKSTLIDRLVCVFRARHRRVGVVAVDPSSPFTGGALLGDRIRMSAHASDPDVFFRSMATRGHLGGIALAAPAAVRVLDAMGFDVVIVETVGVGQSEVAVAGLADCTILVSVPSLGDGIQMIKAGLMEIGDVLVINKADLPGTDDLRRELSGLVAAARPEQQRPPILLTRASDGDGIEALADAIARHFTRARASGALQAARLGSLRSELETWIGLEAGRRILEAVGAERLRSLTDELEGRRQDPGKMARRLVADALARGLEVERASDQHKLHNTF